MARLGEEKKELARTYEAKLAGERGERAREEAEWQRRVDRVRGLDMVVCVCVSMLMALTTIMPSFSCLHS